MTTYRGYEVYKHSFGGQGPVLLEALNILENFDLKSMKLNSPEYLHTVVEALKLAYADRDTYYGDPAFVRTPGEGLLSKAYAKERAKLIDPAPCLPRVRRRQSAALRQQGEGMELLGRQHHRTSATRPGRCPIPSRSPAPARTPPTSPSSTATATSSTRRRAAAGSAAPSSSATPASA